MISKNNYLIEWQQFLYYAEDSPSSLRWKIDIYSGKNYSILSTPKNTVAGAKQYRKNGEPSKWILKFNGKNYSVAKIVYIIKNKHVDNSTIIDHIDRNPFNNKIENLRPVTEGVNLKNKNLHTNNSSGFMGVTIRYTNDIKYYTATWINPTTNKQQGKSFNANKLGDILAKMKAVVYRYEMITNLGEYGEQHFNCLNSEEINLLKSSILAIEQLRAKK